MRLVAMRTCDKGETRGLGRRRERQGNENEGWGCGKGEGEGEGGTSRVGVWVWARAAGWRASGEWRAQAVHACTRACMRVEGESASKCRVGQPAGLMGGGKRARATPTPSHSLPLPGTTLALC
jgi:hypothetical protein